jgi:sugar phosphate isomerase/epimerase
LVALKRHAFLRGIAISGTAVGNVFTLPKGAKRDGQIAHVKKWIDNAVHMGAPHVRVFAGGTNGRSLKQAQSLCIEALEEVGEYAGKRGVFLGIENHGGIVAEADSLLEIVRATGSEWVGINLDTGNFHTDDVYGDIARCVPHAVNVQLKVQVQPRGAKQKSAANVGRLVKILRDGGYQGFVVLEYEAQENPWVAVPKWLDKLKEAIG